MDLYCSVSCWIIFINNYSALYGDSVNQMVSFYGLSFAKYDEVERLRQKPKEGEEGEYIKGRKEYFTISSKCN